MRNLVRALVLAALLSSQTVPSLVGSSAPEPAPAPTYACESEPAEDTDDVQIGTALTLYRGADAEDASSDCDGTRTQL